MKRTVFIFLALITIIIFTGSENFAQGIYIGPRLTGNLNIYSQKNLTGTWNGVGVGIGGVVDISFSQHIGLLTNLTVFDMKNFSNSQTNNNVTTEEDLYLSYLTLDPMFKAEFSGFYLLGGVSLGIKISSSGQLNQSQVGGQATTQTLNLNTNSTIFNFAVGTGYNFKLSPGMLLGADFTAYIPVSDTYDFPGISNSVLTLKLGASLKFRIN